MAFATLSLSLYIFCSRKRASSLSFGSIASLCSFSIMHSAMALSSGGSCERIFAWMDFTFASLAASTRRWPTITFPEGVTIGGTMTPWSFTDCTSSSHVERGPLTSVFLTLWSEIVSVSGSAHWRAFSKPIEGFWVGLDPVGESFRGLIPSAFPSEPSCIDFPSVVKVASSYCSTGQFCCPECQVLSLYWGRETKVRRVL